MNYKLRQSTLDVLRPTLHVNHLTLVSTIHKLSTLDIGSGVNLNPITNLSSCLNLNRIPNLNPILTLTPLINLNPIPNLNPTLYLKPYNNLNFF